MADSRRRAVLALVATLALAGCTATSHESEAHSGSESSDVVESLWSSRTAYVGDNSQVAALVREAGFAAMGDVSISLQTAHEPYGLTVDLEDGGDAIDEADVQGPAVILLGLIGNLEEVSVAVGERVYVFTATSVSDDLGYEVKSLGEDQDRLAAYVRGVAVGDG